YGSGTPTWPKRTCPPHERPKGQGSAPRSHETVTIQRRKRTPGREPRAASADAPTELVLDGGRIEPARREQHIAVEPEVGELLDEPLVALARAGERGLDPLLA